MIEKKLVDVLLGDTTVTGLVGTRVFPVVIRDDTALPAITYQRLSGERSYTLSGRSGWATVRVGVSVWAREYAQAREAADAVRNALDAYDSDDPTDIQVATVSDGADTYDADIDVFGCSLDIEIKYQEV